MRLDETACQHLVDGFYDAALEPTLWEHALVRASDAMSAIGAMYISLDIQRPTCSRVVLGRLDSDLTQPYLATHCAHDPWTRINTSARPGTTYALDAFVPTSTLVRTPIYADILRPQGIVHSASAILERHPERSIGFAIFRSAQVGPAGDRDLELLAALAPHVKRASQIAWRLAAAATRDEAKSSALDQIDHGVVLVDGRGRVLFTNHAADRIIALGDGFSLASRGLRAKSAADTRCMEALIAGALTGAAGGTMRVARPSLAEPWLVLVAPARSRGLWSVNGCAAAIIFISDPERAPMPTHRMLRDLFELTPTEAKVALSIAAGNDVPDAARELRISTNTVHTHLRRIFRKLGVGRQADLVRVLIRAGIAMPPGDRGATIGADDWRI
jgi:DNA-binding CsgD family transcriptional regulator/PAS domain-containing protein